MLSLRAGASASKQGNVPIQAPLPLLALSLFFLPHQGPLTADNGVSSLCHACRRGSHHDTQRATHTTTTTITTPHTHTTHKSSRFSPSSRPPLSLLSLLSPSSPPSFHPPLSIPCPTGMTVMTGLRSLSPAQVARSTQTQPLANAFGSLHQAQLCTCSNQTTVSLCVSMCACVGVSACLPLSLACFLLPPPFDPFVLSHPACSVWITTANHARRTSGGSSRMQRVDAHIITMQPQKQQFGTARKEETLCHWQSCRSVFPICC